MKSYLGEELRKIEAQARAAAKIASHKETVDLARAVQRMAELLAFHFDAEKESAYGRDA